MTKVMLIDDDASMQALIDQIARRGGYDFCYAGSGAEGLEMLRAERPDFLILDVMLPDINGFEICEIIRAEGRKVPVMFLTAKGDIVDKSIGFKAGADDYLVKPFQPEELLLRLNAHLRRRQREREGAMPDHRAELFRTGDLEIHFGKYDVRLGGEPVALSSREIELFGGARLRCGLCLHARPDPGGALGEQGGGRSELHHRHGAQNTGED